MVKHIANALGHEPQVRGLAPDEQIESHVQQFAAEGRDVDAEGGGEPEEFVALPEVGAPEGVVEEELLAEGADDAGVEGVGVPRRGVEAHLGVGEVEDQVLPLVADVVGLEAEECGQPVEEVGAGAGGPVGEGRPAKVVDDLEGGGGGADLQEPEGGVVDDGAVDGDDVVDLVRRRRRRGRRRV